MDGGNAIHTSLHCDPKIMTTHPRQSTISGSVSWSGVGIHTGQTQHIRFLPAKPFQGVVFEVHQAHKVVRIPAHVDHVCSTAFCTSLHADGVQLHTVEHVLATIYALGITNVIIEIHGSEVPMGDGSAHGWAIMLEPLITTQHYLAKCVQMISTVRVGDDHAWCELSPASTYELQYDLHFDHAMLREQHVHVEELTPHMFMKHVAWARTFGFHKDLHQLQQQNKALGAHLDNTLVFDSQSVLNPEGMRSHDEPCRHKILDAVGDLSLWGMRIQGRFHGHRSGHALNHKLIKQVLNSSNSWKFI